MIYADSISGCSVKIVPIFEALIAKLTYFKFVFEQFLQMWIVSIVNMTVHNIMISIFINIATKQLAKSQFRFLIIPMIFNLKWDELVDAFCSDSEWNVWRILKFIFQKREIELIPKMLITKFLVCLICAAANIWVSSLTRSAVPWFLQLWPWILLRGVAEPCYQRRTVDCVDPITAVTSRTSKREIFEAEELLHDLVTVWPLRGCEAVLPSFGAAVCGQGCMTCLRLIRSRRREANA